MPRMLLGSIMFHYVPAETVGPSSLLLTISIVSFLPSSLCKWKSKHCLQAGSTYAKANTSARSMMMR